MPTQILNSGRILSAELLEEVAQVATRTELKVTDELQLNPVDVVICDYPGLGIEQIGVGGYSPGPHGRWAGYALGTELCRRFLRQHALTAREAVHARADEFPQSWSSLS